MDPRFEVYKDRKGEWRWRLRAHNKRIIADSAEGYKRRHAVMNGIAAVRSLAPLATVTDLELASDSRVKRTAGPLASRKTRATRV